MRALSPDDRLRLMRFVCSFAWADLKVQDEERALIRQLIGRLDLDPAEAEQVEGWLRVPPLPEEVDPAEVPAAHRELFLRAARAVVSIDGKVAQAERDALRLLEQLL